METHTLISYFLLNNLFISYLLNYFLSFQKIFNLKIESIIWSS